VVAAVEATVVAATVPEVHLKVAVVSNLFTVAEEAAAATAAVEAVSCGSYSDPCSSGSCFCESCSCGSCCCGKLL
jgi:hypothetical protein